MHVDFFEKTELTIHPVLMEGVNLTEIAETIASALEIDIEYVQVIDAKEDILSLDITAPDVEAEQFFGKGEMLLEALAEIPGLSILPETTFYSNGVLGNLSLDAEMGRAVARSSDEMAKRIVDKIKHRVCVFPTGSEVIAGLIEDTNSPFIKKTLEALGAKVVIASPIPDDRNIAMGRLETALDDGYGLIITSGGVGAEAKDVNVDAVASVSDESYLVPVVHFTAGEGRHLRDAVRIGVGVSGPSVLVTLPGPHAEVEACMPALIEFYESKISPAELADKLAGILRDRWAKSYHHMNHHESD